MKQFLTASTTSMNHARANLTLTTLGDGRVLAVGGDINLGPGEIYDPATATWTDTAGSMNVPRSGHQAVLLNSGKVLISGGVSSLLDPSDELFDPATGTFSIVGTNESPHLFAVRLADGRVLEVGGTSRLFDETTQTFTAAASPSVSHSGGVALLLDDGRVFVAGGTSGTASVEAYSPATGTWAALAPTSLPRAYASALKLPDGSVVLVNGSSGPVDSFTAVFNRYTPSTNSWATFGSDRSSNKPLLALSTTGTVYSLGGYGSPFAEVIDPATNSYRRIGALLSTHSVGAIASLGQGQFLIAGGTGSNGPQSDAELYSECTVTTTCAGANATCGWVPDNCGGNLNCGTCNANSVCTANQCVCVPRTCAEQEKDCGDTTDGCGAPLNCGTCLASEVCSSNVCIIPGVADYSASLKAPACLQVTNSCDSTMTIGRGWSEPNTPNTINNSCADGAAGGFHTSESLDRLKISSLDGNPLNSGKLARIDATVWTAVTYGDWLDLYSAANASSPAWTYLTTLSTGVLNQSTLSTTFRLPSGTLQAIRGVYRYGGSASTCGPGNYNDRDDLVFAVANVPDTTAPTTAITNPLDGATIRNTVTVTATASDDYGLAQVTILDGNNAIGNSATAPFTVSWSPTLNGTHVLKSRAVDLWGNVTFSAPITVTVDRDFAPPAVSITAPASNAVVSGQVTVSANATDNVAVSIVYFYLDASTYLGSSTTPPYSMNWNTASTTNGTHGIFARAYDSSNNSAWSDTILVTVNNADTTAPSVAFTNPASGATLYGTVTVTATASDNNAVTRVELYDGATLLGTSTGPSYSFTWNTTTAANGSRTLTLRAYDAANNQGTATRPVTVSNTSAPANTAVFDSTRRAPACASFGRSCTTGTLINGRSALGPEVNSPNTINNSCYDGASGGYHSDESLDGLLIETVDGTAMAAGKTVRVTATVWAYSGYTADMLDIYSTTNVASPSWSLIGTFIPPGAGARTISTTFTLPPGGLQAIRGVFRYSGSASPCAAGSYDDRDDLIFAVQ
ncbi:MAG: Ig-like domain-containing protein [Archangium sp.]